MNKTRWLAAAMISMGLAACGKSDGGSAGTSAGIDEATWKSLRDSDPRGTWEQDVAAIEKVLGPVKVKNDAEMIWAVDSGNACWLVKAKKRDGKFGVAEYSRVEPRSEDRYAKCAAYAKGQS